MPAALAERLAGEADAVARLLEAGDACGAAARATALQKTAIAALNRPREVPDALKEDLGSGVADVVARAQAECAAAQPSPAPPPPPPPPPAATPPADPAPPAAPPPPPPAGGDEDEKEAEERGKDEKKNEEKKEKGKKDGGKGDD